MVLSAVNWDVFTGLPGATDDNFEKLCRHLMRRHYGRYGDFAARAAQPGVEFHLKLHTACSLGDPGRWYGWQCRWYDLPSGRALGATRRRKIKEAIATTLKEVPGITDWVLWTRHPLTAADQRWFYGLDAGGMMLKLWTSTEVEEHLSGDGLILRGTYFGELVLTPESLADIHATCVAPIRPRWLPEVHQQVDAERTLRGMLAGTDTRDDLQRVVGRLRAAVAAIDDALNGLEQSMQDRAAELRDVLAHTADQMTEASTALAQGDFEALRQQTDERPALSAAHRATLRALRNQRQPVALTVTNAISDALEAGHLMANVRSDLDVGLVAVLADAGCGKTQLAAQLTAATADRPAGVLLHGRDLHARGTLDDLAHKITISGYPCPGMEALVAALDAAGERARRRLPIVIDGLNESEDPRDWRDLLASVRDVMRKYSHVLLICTLRSGFADDCLPDQVDRLEISNFGPDTREAVRRYFDYYRIDPVDADLPFDLLQHPLYLRLFCEVTNPDRDRVVGIEAMPGSLAALFDRVLEQAAERIARLSPTARRIYEPEVRDALETIGIALWESRRRAVGRTELRRLIDDNGPWDSSIVRALEHEGILLRMPGETPGPDEYVVTFDALAGHIIADASLARRSRDDFQAFLSEDATFEAFTADPGISHPLAGDTFVALAALLPRRFARQLWPMLDEQLRPAALHAAADLEARYLDAATVNELAALATQSPGGRDILDRLRDIRGAPGHPLNAEFLDSILRPLGVAERDLRWTEWIRRNESALLADLRDTELRWRRSAERGERDDLRARWIMWIQTSTVRQLRDQATRTLYWYGRATPAALFGLTLDSLEINDPYVPERLLAACYGVAMANQIASDEFSTMLAGYLSGLAGRLAGATATHATSHWLARLYVEGTVLLARVYYPSIVPSQFESAGRLPLAAGPAIDSIGAADTRADECDKTMHMDFKNYTLGRLVPGRQNYDMANPDLLQVVAHVRGVVWNLGWREATFGSLEQDIARRSERSQVLKTDRYGKKYGWIGYYTAAGELDDADRLELRHDRLADVDLDPSFPEPPPTAPVSVPDWARPTPTNDRVWVRKGVVKVPDDLLQRSEINGVSGPWVAVHGNLETVNQAPGRFVWGHLRGMLVGAEDADLVERALQERRYPGNDWVPQARQDYYIFAGEIPWHPDFAADSPDDPSKPLYVRAIDIDQEQTVDAEVLAHEFNWEDYHSALNRAGGTLVPSRAFSSAFDLRALPQDFRQATPDGSVASISFSAPIGYSGHLLYLREDLLARHANGRPLILFMWGERQPHPFPDPAPAWLKAAWKDQAQIWRNTHRIALH